MEEGIPDAVHDPIFLDTYRRSINNPGIFWGDVAKLLHWDRMWTRVMDNSNPPFTKWFEGGLINACYNAVDRHVLEGRGDKVAIIHDSPMTNTTRHMTYKELYEEVSVLAGGLKSLGVTKGDRIVIYMPIIPEAIIAMLATVRLGAVHSVVFGGFAAPEVCTRIEHAKPKLVLTANCGVEPGKVIPYLDILHSAVAMSKWKPMINVVFLRSHIVHTPINPTTDILWSTVKNLAMPAACVPVEANDPMYILYTSGTTNKPKGIQRPTGGHLAALMYTMSNLYGIRPDGVCWSASDLGWAVGHSYICYGPLLYGATTVMYEGKPDRTPDPGQYYRIIEEHKVNTVFSVPTAFRVLRRVDPEVKYGKRHSLSSLRSIYLAGEYCDMETKSWIERTFKVPVLNSWWQTETGSAITATCMGFTQNLNVPKLTVGLPFIGYNVKVFQPDGTECKPNKLGRIVVKLPLPPGNMSTLYKSDELFKTTYFQKFPGYYDTMDAGYMDEDGYVFVTARDDDVINVAGHRISTMSLEDAVLRHKQVVDCAVFGVPEPTKGQVPLCLFIPREDTKKTEAKLAAEIIQIIRDVIGPLASFRLVASVSALPRTRSGKTMRKVMADMAGNKLVTVPGTMEDPSVLPVVRSALQRLGYAMNTPDPVLGTRS